MNNLSKEGMFRSLWEEYSDSFNDIERQNILSYMIRLKMYFTDEEFTKLIEDLPGYIDYWNPQSELNLANFREAMSSYLMKENKEDLPPQS